MQSECTEEYISMKYDKVHAVEGQSVPDELMDLLGEIIDNSRSAAEANSLIFNISIFIEEIEKDKIVSIKVKDESGGINKKDFETVFSPGYSGSIKGFLNNFGYGLKKTLWIIQYYMDPNDGCLYPKSNWYIKTATTEDLADNNIRLLESPLVDEIKIKTIKNDTFQKPGTEVGFTLDSELYPLFAKLPMKGAGRPSFKRRIYRLHEQIAWCHGPSINIKGSITIYHKTIEEEIFSKEVICPLYPVWRDERDGENQSGREKITFCIPYLKDEYLFEYEYGLLRTPTKVKEDAERRQLPNRHIYPLTKYDKNPGSAGIDIIIGGSYGKRICRISLNEMFGVGASKLEYESYHGVLICPENLPISCLHNIKKNINKWNPIMNLLMEKIKTTQKATPTSVCMSTPEKEIHDALKPLLSDRGELIHEFSVNKYMPGLGERSPLKVDFMIHTYAGHYEVIEVSKALDLEHIYKMDSYRKFIEMGWSDIQFNPYTPPDIHYILITPDPKDPFMLEYLKVYKFDHQPLSKFNIRDLEIR